MDIRDSAFSVLMRSVSEFRLIVFVVLIGSIVPAASVRAQAVQWEQLPGPPGGVVYSLHSLPEGRSAARVEGRVFFSEDDAHTWRDITPPTPAVATLAASDDGVLFASDWYETTLGGAQRGIFRSNDYGATWESMQVDASVAWVYSFHGGHNGAVFAGTDRGLFRSADQGETWMRMEVVPEHRLDAVATNDEGDVVALDENMIYLSEDGGNTWGLPVLVPDSIYITNIAIRGDMSIYGWNSTANALYHSTDKGQIWTVFKPNENISGANSAISCGEEEDYFSAGRNLFQSSDAGKTWSNVELPFGEILSCTGSQEGEFLIGTERGVFRRDGESWLNSSRGIEHTIIDVLRKGRENLLYAGGFFGELWRSDDGGQSWKLLSNEIGKYGLTDIAVSQLNENVLAVVSGGSSFRSIDG